MSSEGIKMARDDVPQDIPHFFGVKPPKDQPRKGHLSQQRVQECAMIWNGGWTRVKAREFMKTKGNNILDFPFIFHYICSGVTGWLVPFLVLAAILVVGVTGWLVKFHFPRAWNPPTTNQLTARTAQSCQNTDLAVMDSWKVPFVFDEYREHSSRLVRFENWIVTAKDLLYFRLAQGIFAINPEPVTQVCAQCFWVANERLRLVLQLGGFIERKASFRSIDFNVLGADRPISRISISCIHTSGIASINSENYYTNKFENGLDLFGGLFIAEVYAEANNEDSDSPWAVLQTVVKYAKGTAFALISLVLSFIGIITLRCKIHNNRIDRSNVVTDIVISIVCLIVGWVFMGLALVVFDPPHSDSRSGVMSLSPLAPVCLTQPSALSGSSAWRS